MSIPWYMSAAGHTTKSASPSPILPSFVVSNGSDGGRVSKQVLKRRALKFNKKKIPVVPRLTEPSFSFKNLEAKRTMAEMTQFSQISKREYVGEVWTCHASLIYIHNLMVNQLDWGLFMVFSSGLGLHVFGAAAKMILCYLVMNLFLCFWHSPKTALSFT